jgi:hypothetical protein
LGEGAACGNKLAINSHCSSVSCLSSSVVDPTEASGSASLEQG